MSQCAVLVTLLVVSVRDVLIFYSRRTRVAEGDGGEDVAKSPPCARHYSVGLTKLCENNPKYGR